MPLIKPKGPNSGEEGAQRTSFRPPWVKEGPTPLPMPSAPWTLKRRESQPQQQPPSQNKVNPIPVQRQDTKQEKHATTIPVQRQESKQEKNATAIAIQRQDTKQETNATTIPVQRQDTTQEKNATTIPVQRQDTKQEKKATTIPDQSQETKQGKNIQQNKDIQERKKNAPFQRMDAVDEKSNLAKNRRKEPIKGKEMSPPSKKEESKPPSSSKETSAKPEKKEEVKKKVQIKEEPKVMGKPPGPAPPMAPPMPPPPPPMASAKPPIDTKPLTVAQQSKLESLKSRPRRRPDWTDMMKEVEEGVKLKHVQCNDRSAPVIPKAKAKGQFVYDSEKEIAHNQLLKEIQSGVRLKKVKCNDRSKPILDGLRKFRRQMTIEEQIVKKSTSMADVVAMATQPDELDDIDKVRDDLQSTKQMLAHELRNKETLERENRRLMARLLNMEAELEKEKTARSIEKQKGEIVQVRTPDDDKLISKLKEESEESSKMAKEIEDMYKKTAEELDATRAKLESAWLQNAALEQQLKNISIHPDAPVVLPKLASSKKLANASFSARPVLMSSSEEESEEEESEEESESEEDDGGTNTAAQQEKRTARELKMLTAKLRGFKEKRYNAKREKSALKHQFSNLTKCLKQENKKYRQIQKEVDKMAKLVKDVDEDDMEEEEEEEEIEESESENESESSDDSVASEGDLPETASGQDRILNLSRRVKCNENRLTSLKKCNYLLKANIDRRQDEINKQKEAIISLQEDLNAVLEELG